MLRFYLYCLLLSLEWKELSPNFSHKFHWVSYDDLPNPIFDENIGNYFKRIPTSTCCKWTFSINIWNLSWHLLGDNSGLFSTIMISNVVRNKSVKNQSIRKPQKIDEVHENYFVWRLFQRDVLEAVQFLLQNGRYCMI